MAMKVLLQNTLQMSLMNSGTYTAQHGRTRQNIVTRHLQAAGLTLVKDGIPQRCKAGAYRRCSMGPAWGSA